MHFWHKFRIAGEWEDDDEKKKREEKLTKTENICRPVARVATVIAVVVDDEYDDDDFVVWLVALHWLLASHQMQRLCLHKDWETKIVNARQGHTTNNILFFSSYSCVFCLIDFLIRSISIIFRIKSRNGTRRRLNRFLLTGVTLRFRYYLMTAQRAYIIFKQESCTMFASSATRANRILIDMLSTKPLTVLSESFWRKHQLFHFRNQCSLSSDGYGSRKNSHDLELALIWLAFFLLELYASIQIYVHSLKLILISLRDFRSGFSSVISQINLR